MPIVNNTNDDTGYDIEQQRYAESQTRRRPYSWVAYGVSRPKRDKTAREMGTSRLLLNIVKSKTALILSCTAVLVLFGFITLTKMATLAGVMQNIDSYKKELSEKKQNIEVLETAVAELNSPTRIFDIARNTLGMVDPAYVIEIE